MRRNNYGHERMESQILNIINYTLKNEIYDAYIKQCCFTAVKLSIDGSLATVYVDVIDRGKIAQMIEKLNVAKSVFRSGLAHNMNVRKVPDIRFIKDESIDNSLKIDKLLDNI
ncbi:MAG: 30S ribosome-binding factor RbfA [Mycoplasmataceae bacterium]|jgi:ribosome-binding factor A|nr:30S ribosome-binding factor RbfA [Mycoplasmataceae bacterium]